MLDKFHDECGVFGIWGHPEAANLTYLGLHALQHRGQESAGIVTSDGASLHLHKGVGLVADVFNAGILERLPGDAAVGHVRYSTAGGAGVKNAQPFAVEYGERALALAHNGNLVNAGRLRRELQEQGTIFTSSSDTEVVLHLFARSRETDLVGRLSDALRRAEGAYSMLLLTEDRLVGVRDPRGFRPLILGKVKDSHVLCSESCALDLIEAEYVREVLPGEVVIIDREGVRSFFPFEKQQPARCVFEHIYFARPDSVLYGSSVYATRSEMGRRLAQEHAVEADLVIPVPDSGVPAAIGYAEKSGIPFGMGLVRSHYVGRTFIEPQQSIRHFGVKLKLNALGGVLGGKRVVVVDDSLIRGTTSRKIVHMLRAAGAREVHLRISSPPTTWPCYYGIDTPNREELIASSSTVSEIAGFVGADSLGYLSVAGMHGAVGGDGPAGYCDACFTGNYRVPVVREERQRTLRVLDA